MWWRNRNSRGGLLPHVIALQLGALLLVMVPTTQILALDTGEDPVIHLAVAANTVDTVISEVIVREAYERIGYRVEITKYPPERALKLANSGQACSPMLTQCRQPSQKGKPTFCRNTYSTSVG